MTSTPTPAGKPQHKPPPAVRVVEALGSFLLSPKNPIAATNLAEALEELIGSRSAPTTAPTTAPAAPAPSADPDKLLSLRETADVLGVSVRSISRVRADPDSGFPPATMVGALPRWSREDITDWAERQARKPQRRCRRGRR